MTHQRQEPEAVTNDVSGEATNVVQAGTIEGGVHIGAQSNRDISVVLEYESDEVYAAIDGDKFLSVEISNRRAGSRRLALHADGIPSTMWEIIPDLVTVSRDEPVRARVRLHCTGNEPAAGPYDLRLWAEDAEPGHGASWPSNVKKVIVTARPALAAALNPASRISNDGRYRATLRLKNTGNTELEGSLGVSDKRRNDSRYLDSSQIGVGEPDPFRLSRGDTVDRPITISVPAQTLRDRHWRVPLVVDCERDDVVMIPSELSITQYGWLSDVSLWVVRAVKRLCLALQHLRAWGARLEQRRRGVLVGWVGAGLAAGALLGLLMASSSGDAATTTDSGPVPTSAPANALPDPGTNSDTRLPCQPGMSVVVLASLTSADATAYGNYLATRERSRMTRLKPVPKQLYDVHISRRDQICLDVVANAPPEFAFFLWVGPVPSSEGAEVCKELGKTQRDDCYPVLMR